MLTMLMSRKQTASFATTKLKEEDMMRGLLEQLHYQHRYWILSVPNNSRPNYQYRLSEEKRLIGTPLLQGHEYA